jgi:hypothetical protein
MLQLSGNSENGLHRGHDAGSDDLFERLASLPGADPASFETAQLAFTPGSRLALNLWERNLRCWQRQRLSWKATLLPSNLAG